jgi:hypothetical protein
MYIPFIITNINQTLELDHYNEYTKHIRSKIYNENIAITLSIIYVIIFVYFILWYLYTIMMKTIRIKLKNI